MNAASLFLAVLLLIFRLSSHRKVSGSNPENGMGAPFFSLDMGYGYGYVMSMVMLWAMFGADSGLHGAYW